MRVPHVTRKVLLPLILTALAVLAVLTVLQIRMLHKAHSTFENYYAFRGCTQLLKRTPTYGICRTSSSHTIEIVLYKGKWYLKDDLPTDFLGHLL